MKSIFQDEVLDYQDFSNKCLIGVKFKNCSIRFCKFDNSDISYAEFDSCDLYNTTFSGSVFYFTRVSDCDATKAKFTDSFLNGIRLKDTVITYAEFGVDFKTNKERKSIQIESVSDKFLICHTGDSINPITNIEKDFIGIHSTDKKIAFEFIATESSEWKTWRRKSEVALQVKKIIEDNGYTDKALEYYFLHRRYLRKSYANIFHRFLDYSCNELFWGYGVRILNPVIVFFLNSILFSVLYSILPLLNPNSGIKYYGKIVNLFNETFAVGLIKYFEILYSSILISCLSLFGDIDIVGYGRPLAILHVLISVLSIGLGVTALSKKLANA
ncbi:MAG TPA: pentapeptide repeat-containing protein [Saprospiraceae bacterium]|nr:pentapeptide repeat-containing protein [Saprospiraceae bacterium]